MQLHVVNTLLEEMTKHETKRMDPRKHQNWTRNQEDGSKETPKLDPC